MNRPGDEVNPTAPSSKPCNLEIQGRIRRVELARGPGSDAWFVALDGSLVEVNARLIQPGILGMILDGRIYHCVLDEGAMEKAVVVNGERFIVGVDDPRSLAARRKKRSAAGGEQTIKAPMPGRIIRVLVQAGQDVEAHQAVVAIEAMKMQNELRTLRAGTVREVRVAAGLTVAAGEILVVLS